MKTKKRVFSLIVVYLIVMSLLLSACGPDVDPNTVKATGKLNFTSETKEVEVKVDFGEPTVETRTYSISELVITGGSSTPLDGEFAIDYDDVKVALEDRKNRLAESKEKAANRGTSGKAPAAAPAKKFSDLGF